MSKLRMCVALAAFAAVSVFPAASTFGQAGGLRLVTNYPAVLTGAGKNVTFNVQVITPDRRRVDLSFEQIPAGWNAVLRGGGAVVTAVMGGPEDPPDRKAPEVTVEVQIPADAPPGDHTINLRGSGGGATDVLPLTMRISDTAAGVVTLSPDYATLRGKADTAFTFKVTLKNNTPEQTTFGLTAEGPPGWLVEAHPTAEAKAATVTVDGGSTSTIDVVATPPKDAEAKTYEVKVVAQGGGKTAETTVTAEITGSSQLDLNTEDEKLNVDARAGKTTIIDLVLRNNGTAPLNDITLTSSAPSAWKVEYEPTSVQELAPKKTATVKARMTPSGDALAGDYNVTLTASGGGASSSKELRVAIKTSYFWGIIALLLIVGTFLGLRRVFQKYGRR